MAKISPIQRCIDRNTSDEARPITSELAQDGELITISNSINVGDEGGLILRINADGSVKWERIATAPSTLSTTFPSLIATLKLFKIDFP